MVNVTPSYSPKTFALEGSKLLLDLCLADSKIIYFWYVLKYIHKFIIELYAVHYLLVRWYKKQRRVRVISNFTEGETFSSLMTTNYSCGESNNAVPILAHLKKGFPLPFNLDKKRKNLDTQFKGELTDLFWKFAGCSLFPRVGIGWWTIL